MLGMGEITVISMIIIMHGLWIWGIIEALRRRDDNGDYQILIIIAIVLTHFVGASIYLVYCYRFSILDFIRRVLNYDDRTK
jgi:uncharacterized membrane protein YidH (DUF202 family)